MDWLLGLIRYLLALVTQATGILGAFAAFAQVAIWLLRRFGVPDSVLEMPKKAAPWLERMAIVLVFVAAYQLSVTMSKESRAIIAEARDSLARAQADVSSARAISDSLRSKSVPRTGAHDDVKWLAEHPYTVEVGADPACDCIEVRGAGASIRSFDATTLGFFVACPMKGAQRKYVQYWLRDVYDVVREDNFGGPGRKRYGSRNPDGTGPLIRDLTNVVVDSLSARGMQWCLIETRFVVRVRVTTAIGGVEDLFYERDVRAASFRRVTSGVWRQALTLAESLETAGRSLDVSASVSRATRARIGQQCASSLVP